MPCEGSSNRQSLPMESVAFGKCRNGSLQRQQITGGDEETDRRRPKIHNDTNQNRRRSALEFVFSMMLVFDSKPGLGECAIKIIAGVRTAYVAVVTRGFYSILECVAWNFMSALDGGCVMARSCLGKVSLWFGLIQNYRIRHSGAFIYWYLFKHKIYIIWGS